jgi:hypothetical protein
MRNPNPLKAGDILWNGAVVSQEFAESYNRLQERINAFEAANRPVPEYLILGSHNLMSGYMAR